MGQRKIYNTTLDSELTRGVRILAAQLGKRQNDLLEEAIQDLLKKYIQDLETPLFGLSKG
jgi:predicted transcriptional regulator